MSKQTSGSIEPRTAQGQLMFLFFFLRIACWFFFGVQQGQRNAEQQGDFSPFLFYANKSEVLPATPGKHSSECQSNNPSLAEMSTLRGYVPGQHQWGKDTFFLSFQCNHIEDQIMICTAPASTSYADKTSGGEVTISESGSGACDSYKLFIPRV